MLTSSPAATHVVVCGPPGMMGAVQVGLEELGYGAKNRTMMGRVDMPRKVSRSQLKRENQAKRARERAREEQILANKGDFWSLLSNYGTVGAILLIVYMFWRRRKAALLVKN